MKDLTARLLEQALDTLAGDVFDADAIPGRINIERTRDPSHGDVASNIALVMAKAARMKPRELAERIVAALPDADEVARVEIAGPGFINFHFSSAASLDLVAHILGEGERYGGSRAGAGVRVLLEYISANPTGPLHVGHGRLAAYGATLGNLLRATGHEVHEEYYVNDAGRQMDILATSVWLRYLQLHEQPIVFPSNGYRGDYIAEISGSIRDSEADRLVYDWADVARELPADATEANPQGNKEAHIDALIANAKALLGETDYRLVLDAALTSILHDIREDLAEFGVRQAEWFSERALFSRGLIEHALEKLVANGHVYEKDGAMWLRATDFGDEKDRVVRRENGQTTYFASDIAYHLNKRERGFDQLLDVLGSDHHGYVARVRGGLQAMGEPGESLEVRLVQFVTLYRAGEKVQMSTRSGSFVTLRELREEVGNDAARLFYVSRSNDQHLDFDLELAKENSKNNPVYYIQYAHARVCSVFRKLSAETGSEWDRAGALTGLDALTHEREHTVLRSLAKYPEVVQLASDNRAPQHVVHYLRDLANDFHSYYDSVKILKASDKRTRDARLALSEATRQVIANGLALLGVSAPASM